MDNPNDRNIVAMNDFRADSGYGPIAQVESYWEGLRGTRLLPKRSDIDPRGIEMALEYSFVLERIAPGMARLRIAGNHLGDLMGMEVRGMPLTSFIAPSGRRALSDTLEEVFQRPAICELDLIGESGLGKPALEARMLLLPLKSDLGDVSRVLGCLVSKGEMGKKPRRFEIAKTTMRPIEAPATVPLPVHVVEAEKLGQQMAGLAEDAPVFKHRTPRDAAPYLRLVKSGD